MIYLGYINSQLGQKKKKLSRLSFSSVNQVIALFIIFAYMFFIRKEYFNKKKMQPTPPNISHWIKHSHSAFNLYLHEIVYAYLGERRGGKAEK